MKYAEVWETYYTAKMRSNTVLDHTTPLHKIMFIEHDIEFEEMAADSVRRRAQIASLTRRRPFMFFGVIVIFICALVEMWVSGKGAISAVFSTAIFWGIYIKQESDLRLLRVIDWLQKGSDDKPVA